MSAQQTPAPRHRRTAFVAVALLLVALTVGAVTAVHMFPTSASERSLAEPPRPMFPAAAADRAATLERFRAQERADPAQAADRAATLERFRAQERADPAQAGRIQQTWSDRLNGLAAKAGVLPSAAP
jgi:DMSO/TMAO reductase YedYZ molybdopterin-dependent catalytic subunit